MRILKRLFGFGTKSKSEPKTARPLVLKKDNRVDADRKKRLNDVVNKHSPKGTSHSAAKKPSLKPAQTASRRERVKTRLIEIDRTEQRVVDLIGESSAAKTDELGRFPVGWLVVIKGPGRGRYFSLYPGRMQIGRGADQAISLNFDDRAISRSNHASIVFDIERNQFFLGHGGKANIIRLNGKPVLSDETLSDGDDISIGETVLKIKILASSEFIWAEPENNKERKYVASA